MGRGHATPPTPRGNTLEGQLRMSYRQVLRNGAMGIDQCAFLGTHFGVDSATVRKAFISVAPGGHPVDEEKFLEVMQHALANSRIRASERPRQVNRNIATLHKQLSISPFAKVPIVLPTAAALPDVATLGLSLSPASSKRPKLPSQLMSPTRLNRSEDRGIGASTPVMSASKERSHSVPPMTPRALGSTMDTLHRPGSAFYLKPYTPRGSFELPTWKWNQVDSNVPRNIRNVLLRPMKMSSRPVTPAPMKSPEMTKVLDRTRAAMRGITRMEAIEALTAGEASSSAAAPTSPSARRHAHTVTLTHARNALQMLGLDVTEDEVRLLAAECKALPDADVVLPMKLTNAIIPIAGHVDVRDVGIDPKSFAHFKKQRLSFTHALSKKEAKLLELIRSKLTETCLGGPAELRKAFKLVDEEGTGRCSKRGMVMALELQGLGMSATDADILHSILDPDQRGMDYNEFTAMMMPPDIAESREQTVVLGWERGDSKSRQGLRNRQMSGSDKAKVKAKPDPDEVPKFMSRLTPENVIQILKNRVALALKAGPGAIRKWFCLFDKDGNNEIDESELQDLMVDFGLNLSPAQVAALMAKIDSNQNGLLDQGELIAALLPGDQFALTANEAELRDPFQVGAGHAGGVIQGDDLRNFLKDKLIRTFVKKGDSTSAGYQIREAISRFDTNRDGSMSKLELRKALNGLGLSVDDDILESLMHIYQDDEKGSAEYSKFVEDIDPDAFNFAFSAGMCAKSGSFEKVEKEGVASFLDPPEKTRNSLKAALKARQKRDGYKSVLKEIQAYGDGQGRLSSEAFRAMLLRLGLKISKAENLKVAYKAFADADSGWVDVWSFAKVADSAMEMTVAAKKESPRDRAQQPPPKTAASTSDKKQIGASTVVEPKPFG